MARDRWDRDPPQSVFSALSVEIPVMVLIGMATIFIGCLRALWHRSSSRSKPLVAVTHGNLEDFVRQKNALQTIDAIISDYTSYLTGFELPIDLTAFSAEQQAKMETSLTHQDRRDWPPIFASTYRDFLTLRAKSEVTTFALKIYNKLMPPVQPRIAVDQQADQQADQLSADYAISQVRPDYAKLGWQGAVGVENLFSDHAVNFLFQLPRVQGPTGYLDCASNVFASVLAGASETSAH